MFTNYTQKQIQFSSNNNLVSKGKILNDEEIEEYQRAVSKSPLISGSVEKDFLITNPYYY